MLEAGWELTDYFTTIIPTARKSFAAAGLKGVLRNPAVCFMVAHHVSLYGCVPMNIYLVPGPCGTEFALLVVLIAGAIGPNGVMGFVKALLDWSVPWERLLGQAITWVTALLLLATRGIGWLWLWYRMFPKIWGMGSGLFSLSVFCFLGLSGVNVFILSIVLGGLKKIYEVRNVPDHTLRRLIHVQVLETLGNAGNAFSHARLHSAHAHWTEARTAFRMGVLRPDSSPPKPHKQE